ncbi:MAG: peptide ABC transporter substrate-binding protein [Ectothiorhodospiraceae bacterium]|nr:peptide ABC transporter substrate-binding protein [Ectothiorhodospiraceae bacterium]
MIVVQPTLRLADPHICSDDRDRLAVHGALLDALVRRDAAGRLAPALAAGWTVGSDARTWTFRLRPDVAFHDGTPLTARAVVASLRRACDPAVGGELGTEGVWASYLGDAELVATDDHTVRIVCGRPMADLLELLVDIPVLAESALSGGSAPSAAVGTGPYRLVARDEASVTLEGFARATVRHPTRDRLVFRAEPDAGRRLDAVRRGAADVATALAAASARHATADGLAVVSQLRHLCVAFLFDAREGAGANRMLRRAVNHAADVSRMIARCLDGAGQRLNGPLTPRHLGCDPRIAPYAHEPDRARALLDRAGAPERLVVDVPTRLPDEAPRLGELLAEDLAAVGLEVVLRRFEDRPAYAEMVKAKRIDDLCCFDSSPLSTYRVLREKLDATVAGPWWQGYASEEVSDLLALASRTVDDVARRAVYHRAYRRLHDDAPWLFLYRPTAFWVLGRGAEGVGVTAQGLVHADRGTARLHRALG